MRQPRRGCRRARSMPHSIAPICNGPGGKHCSPFPWRRGCGRKASGCWAVWWGPREHKKRGLVTSAPKSMGVGTAEADLPHNNVNTRKALKQCRPNIVQNIAMAGWPKFYYIILGDWNLGWGECRVQLYASSTPSPTELSGSCELRRACGESVIFSKGWQSESRGYPLSKVRLLGPPGISLFSRFRAPPA